MLDVAFEKWLNPLMPQCDQRKLSFMKTSFRAFILALTVWHIASLAIAGETDQRVFPSVEIFVNNHKYGDTNGCTGDFGVTGTMTCGHPGHVSELSWAYLRLSPDGDIYKITRKYPSDLPTSATDTKEVIFNGKPLILWHDNYQQIIMRLKAPK